MALFNNRFIVHKMKFLDTGTEHEADVYNSQHEARQAFGIHKRYFERMESMGKKPKIPIAVVLAEHPVKLTPKGEAYSTIGKKLMQINHYPEGGIEEGITKPTIEIPRNANIVNRELPGMED